ncbi:MAG: PAS domain S-box protein, partial [Dehalococcoidia bacterium]
MARIGRSDGGEPFEVRKVKLPQEADGELDGFTESSTESFFVFDEKLNCVGINPAGQELLDVSEQTAVGKNIAEIIPGADDRRMYQEYLDVVKTKERLVTRAEYGERQLGIKAFKVGDGLGIIASDITDRRLMENDLQRSEEHWQGLFSSLEDATLMVDKNYNIENLNDSGLALVGKSREEVVGEKCYRIICGSESPHELCLLGKAVETGRPQSIDREVFGREVSVRITPLQDQNGEIMKLVETVKDVGKSTRATEETVRDGAIALSVDDAAMADLEGNLLDEIGEDVAGELRSANERIEREVAERERAERELMIKDSALELSLSGFALFDSEKALTHVNRSFLRMWGYDEEAEILGRPFAGLWQSSQGSSEVVAAVSSLGGWEGELVALGKDGSTFDAELSACMIVDEESGHICMVASVVDVTARKRAEEELSRHQGRLDSREDEHATELKYVDDRLQQEVGGRRHAQEELNGLRTHTDELVAQNTAELASANEQLEAEIAEYKFAQDELNQRCSRLEQEADAQAAELRGTTQRLEEETAARREAEEESKKLRDHFEEVLEERAAELKRANQQLEQEKAELVKAIEGSGGPGGQLGEAEEGTAAEPG